MTGFTFTAKRAADVAEMCRIIRLGIDGSHNAIENVQEEARVLGELATKYARYIRSEFACVSVTIAADSYTAGQIELLRLFSVPEATL